MPTRPCKYCKQSVAANAKKCHKCGGKKPYPQEPVPAWFVLTLVVVAIVFGTVFWDDLGLSSDAGKTQQGNNESREVGGGYIIQALGIQDGAGLYWVADRFGNADFSIPKPTAYMGKPAIQCVYSHDGVYSQIFYNHGSAYAGAIITKEKYDQLEAESMRH